MRQFHDFRSVLKNKILPTVARVSQDVLTNVALFSFPFLRQSQDIRESVARHSYECRLVLFSRQIVARCSHVFSRLLHDIRTSVTKSRIVNSPKFHVDTFTTLARMSYDSRMAVLRNILAKKIA